MRNLTLKVSSWLQARQPDEDGQTVIEYALVVAVVSVALIGLMAGFGNNIIADAKSKVEALVA